MFRLTKGRRMKPFLHILSPGSRPSEKGMLYRNNYMNAHARVATIQEAQRTPRERQQLMMLTIPDQTMAFGVVMVTAMIAIILALRQQPYSVNMPKNRWMSGGLNQHEQYERNDEMGKIFDMHKEAVDNTRREIERPEVLRAPQGYESPSGVYS
ncbi:hypothetical protein ABB37_03721 [Leptomonas pyrrhocoris]|uniref:Transmembrane protein n=1 Tax=Leptomonas pyrrhocoris TaxID=157538 RepID=A0A0N1J4X2_LEPPY|nr:hypothetical protein ABB37_03721 [Leptomonas pyrrhocoris]XP_015659762.1 hypothetical protein ABB37_03721 [Leptomonas pyrrhocoris]XP_015659763.1 hypothetical protein ABB37_03721 [Leptomonas pyrrhocoris]KPA81322.1 hypothetical protein ABB37_03721 [Leptomonas pyrrhocoris]KPA81323.1 hypothetical protein ABB37_03721 [Leptomonas pyrrhocoris]KPA81324.1 hypothetical protein ABB37_03721 [Leptomonas pyrrhocoris]|eukprot:XP_015659761.1 hypothetical protein ABB37_03721 [Leptomonas pyrrhocoris]